MAIDGGFDGKAPLAEALGENFREGLFVINEQNCDRLHGKFFEMKKSIYNTLLGVFPRYSGIAGADVGDVLFQIPCWQEC